MTSELTEMKAQAKALVERARVGDQNAMAMITRVKEQSASGSERAKIAFRLLHDYIVANPSGGHGFFARRRTEPRTNFYRLLRSAAKQRDTAQFGSDVAELTMRAPDTNAAAVALADGCLLTKERLHAVAKLLGASKEQRLFLYCVRCTDGRRMRVLVQVLPPDGKKIARAGRAIGLARRIQGIRSGRMPISRLSKMVAWELGE